MKFEGVIEEWRKTHNLALRVAMVNDTLPRKINQILRAEELAFGGTIFLSENELLAIPNLGIKGVSVILENEREAFPKIPERTSSDSPAIRLEHRDTVLAMLYEESSTWSLLHNFKGGV